MHTQLKKYFSILFLFLLLFPIIEKGLHSYEHQKDLHCTATEKHFHDLEHACSICDFTTTDSNNSPESGVQFIISAKEFSFFPFTQQLKIPYPYSNLPSRAPPVA